jgi:AcrR family transcriptional regulator
VVKQEAPPDASIERAVEPLKPLPRGRHGLPRETVTDSQRRRIIDSMVVAVAERGYGDTRVVDVVERAGVSRATFYDLFDDLEDCFLAAFDHVSGQILKAAITAYDERADAEWAERIRLSVGSVLELLAGWPDGARFAIVEVLAAGPNALVRRDAVLRRLAELVDAGRAHSTVDPPGMTSIAVIGGIQEVLYSEVIHGATPRLPDRLPDLVYWITQPFLGSETADAERDRTRQTLRGSA